MTRALIISVAVAAGTLVAALFAFPTGAATALETVVGECKKRTGFGDATCMTLVKKYMNVERCKEYTGYSEEECTKKIEEIKKDPEFSSGSTAPLTPSVPTPSSTGAPVGVVRDSGTLLSLREKKERDLVALWKRTEALTQLLKNEGVDTAVIEQAFPEFEKKAEALVSAYDTYRAVYERTAGDAAATRQSVRAEAKNNVVQSQRLLIEYYRTSILVPIRTAREQAL